jgi:hypothetical protein
MCFAYIFETYSFSYADSIRFRYIELVATQFFTVDYLLNFYLDGSMNYFVELMPIIDALTIMPVYLNIFLAQDLSTFAFLRFVRILRLVRVFRTFKLLRNLSGVKRQMISLTLTLVSMTFLAAGTTIYHISILLSRSFISCNYDCLFDYVCVCFHSTCLYISLLFRLYIFIHFSLIIILTSQLILMIFLFL